MPLGAAVEPADIGRHVAHAQILVVHVDARRLFVLHPAAQHVLDRQIGIVRVMRRVRGVHGHDVGQNRRPDVIVVVGGDAHQLRAFDQEGGVADIGDAHLVVFERGEPERRRGKRRPACPPSRTALGHFRLYRRRGRALRQTLAQSLAERGQGTARSQQEFLNNAPRMPAPIPARQISHAFARASYGSTHRSQAAAPLLAGAAGSIARCPSDFFEIGPVAHATR